MPLLTLVYLLDFINNEQRMYLLPFPFYVDAFSSPGKTPLDKSPTQGRQAAFGAPAWNRLRSSCLVVRVDDLDIHQVRTWGQWGVGC